MHNSPQYNHQRTVGRGHGEGYTMPKMCDICGKTRANNDHRRCSKIRQKRGELVEYIVEIYDGCWLAPWRGDPGRTLVKDSAKRYKTLHGARVAAGIAARKYLWRDLIKTIKICSVKP